MSKAAEFLKVMKLIYSMRKKRFMHCQSIAHHLIPHYLEYANLRRSVHAVSCVMLEVGKYEKWVSEYKIK